MELKHQYIFHQVVNDETGYRLVLIDDDIEIIEIDDDEGTNEDKDTSIGFIAHGDIISLEEADSIWGDKAKSIFIVQNPPKSTSARDGIRRYEPLEHFSALFRKFVATPVIPSGYLEFASKFGFLFDGENPDSPVDHLIIPELYGDETVIYGEQLVSWFRQSLIMAEAISLWDLAQAGDTKALSKYLRWSDGVLGYWTDFQGLEAQFTLIYDTNDPSARAFNFHEGDIIEPARFVAAMLVNSGLQGRVSPQLNIEGDNLTPTLAFNPLNLLGAMWLQLARAIDGDKEYRACRHCGEWFEIGSSGYTRARLFCSNRCRMAYSRAKKKTQEKSP